jgi:hypothetical protein
MFDKFRSKLIKGDKKKSFGNNQTVIMSNPYSVSATMRCFEAGSYDNNYPNITKIAEQFATVFPYAIDAQGNQLKEIPQAVAKLYKPNKQMSGTRFFKTLAVLALVHPAVHIVVWHETNRKGVITDSAEGITPDNIAGYTILEDYRIEIEGGKKVYITSKGNRYTENNIITISLDVNPYSVLSGYSPSMASKKYSTLDDYIADYEKAYFENGAQPAGQLIITAPTEEAFNESVDYLQRKHRGPRGNNNIIYTHRPTNERGEAQNAQIEWIPFNNGGNKALSLGELFEQAEKVRDTAFGVPAEVKGVVKNSNYASVSTAVHIFEKYTVYPKLLQVWTDFTHELNRITGGLGYSITFDYDITPLADEQKIKAETQKIQFDTISNALNAGFALDSIIEAFGLPDDYKKLEQSNVGNEKDPETATDEVSDADQLETSNKSVKSKSIYDVVDKPDPKLVAAIDSAMLDQIEAAIRAKNYEATEERNEKLTNDMFVALVESMVLAGGAQMVGGRLMLTREGIDVPASASYTVSKPLKERYHKFLKNVAQSFNSGTADSIRKVLDKADFERWNEQQTADGLRDIMNTDEWRVQRLSRSEVHRSNGLASLDAMEQIQDETGVKIEKTWHINPFTANHCDECSAMDGKTLDLSTPFISEEDNEFADIESADAHPNCGCYLTYQIARVQKSVECPKCKRHLINSDGGSIKGIKCQGCKCKFDFNIVGGKVISKEIRKEA